MPLADLKVGQYIRRGKSVDGLVLGASNLVFSDYGNYVRKGNKFIQDSRRTVWGWTVC